MLSSLSSSVSVWLGGEADKGFWFWKMMELCVCSKSFAFFIEDLRSLSSRDVSLGFCFMYGCFLLRFLFGCVLLWAARL